MRGLGSWALPWTALVLLGAWLRWPVPWLAAAAAALLTAYAVGRPRGAARAIAAAGLVAACVVAFSAHHGFHRIRVAWDEEWSQREERAAETLARDLDRLVLRGDSAALSLSEAAPGLGPLGAEVPGGRPGSGEEGLLRQTRERYGMDAVAVYGPDGVLEVWDGVHRGAVPERVSSGSARYAYGERPLFSYLYFTRPIPATGGTAVAASLLRTSLPPGLGEAEGGFLAEVEEETGEELAVSRTDPGDGGAVWDFGWEGTTLFSVSVVEPLQAEEREAVLVRHGRIVLVLLFVAWLFLASAGRAPVRGAVAGGVLLILALLLPLGRLLGLPELDSPTRFLLAPPLDATLLRTLAVAAGAALASGLVWRERSRRRRGAAPLLGGTLAVAVGFPVVVGLFSSAPSAEFLARSGPGFVAVQVALALVLGLVAGAGVRVAWRDSEGRRASWLVGGCLGALLLAAVGAAFVVRTGTAPVLLASAWALPALALAVGAGSTRRVPEPVVVALAAGLLAGTCAIPFAWGRRVEARMEMGETELARLASEADPYTEFLLQRLASRADSLERAGAGPVELLYDAWVESGVAEEGIPLWLTLWSSGDLPLEDLRIGLPPPRPVAAEEFLAEARIEGGPVIRRLQRPDARYVAVVPLRTGAALTAVVPPPSVLVPSRFGSTEPLFGGEAGGREDAVDLVPLLAADVTAMADSTIWTRSGAGWTGERTLELPDGRYHAHYRLELPGTTLLAARGSLLLILDLALLALVLGAGVILSSDRSFPVRRIPRVMRTFQGRVTAALFGFFLISVAVFLALGFRTLSGASIRTAEALAERVVDEAAGWYLEVQGSMDLLARRVGADLLEYRNGRLVGGSVGEMVELGLYEGWLPYEIHRDLTARHALTGRATGEVGDWGYVVGYRRMPDGSVLGAPVSLEAAESALRRQEMLDLLGFSLLVGAMLSLALAFLVARTLVRPLRELRGVTGQVGRGNLAVKLPEGRPDEFGAVFDDFNRMVLRLRSAREDLVRTTRRTQAIVEEAATGVVALDADGRVTLVNPRAEELLAAPVRIGDALPSSTATADELSSWVRRYVEDGMRAADTEIHAGERRIRVQARRISRSPRLGGIVLSLEDVTDELRTERILAWGEMAQQVAHEVKNPLTPIKLSVQHIRRAWEDQRPDFAEILERNVEATLREIERLAAIAQSFSRFAAPGASGESPLVPVDVGEVVAETLDLYRSDESRISFRSEVASALPPVRGRAGEVKEVLVNLLENARTALEEKGAVVVAAKAAEEGVELEVRDDGPGIPAHLLPRIFEPHFSTRSSGTGLGLAIVRRLVQSWGGSVTAESPIGEGTTVTVLLPYWRGGGEPEREDPGLGGAGPVGGVSTP